MIVIATAAVGISALSGVHRISRELRKKNHWLNLEFLSQKINIALFCLNCFIFLKKWQVHVFVKIIKMTIIQTTPNLCSLTDKQTVKDLFLIYVTILLVGLLL